MSDPKLQRLVDLLKVATEGLSREEFTKSFKALIDLINKLWGDFVTKHGKAIDEIKPKFIVIMSNERTIPFPLINYSKKININKATVYERIF